MSILTATEVAPFLGIDSTTQGLQEAIDQAENLVAAKMGLSSLELATFTDEQRFMAYTSQQILPESGPVQQLTAFEYDGEDKLSEVTLAHNGWAIRWSDPFGVEFDRVKSFERMKLVKYSYTAGWTSSDGSYPLPVQVAEYVKSMSGIVLNNLLASGVYDTKLGDMTIKIQRETLDKNLEVYEKALRIHARPYL